MDSICRTEKEYDPRLHYPIESLEIATKQNIIDDFNEEIINNEALKETVDLIIGKSKYKYVVSDDDYIIEKSTATNHKEAKIYIKDVSIQDYLFYIINNKSLISYFIFNKQNKKHERFIGFISCVENVYENKIEAIKILDFNEIDSILADVLHFMDNLLNKYNEVHWDAYVDNEKLINAYNTYIERIHLTGKYETEISQNDKIKHYKITKLCKQEE